MATPWIIAHRGHHSVHPENSLGAFQAAVLAGADMVEMDVHRLRDNSIVVFHDEVIDGIALRDMTFRELRDAANRASLAIPALNQVLEMCAGRIRVDLELKGQLEEDGVLRALFDARIPVDNFLLTSFDPNV